VVVVGAGYDTCEDQDAVPNSTCDRTTQRGNRVYVLDGDDGSKIAEFATHGSVAGDITFVDRDFDGFADHAYAATTTGRIYRLDFVDPATPGNIRTCTSTSLCNWTISEVARTTNGNRKFLFAPAALPGSAKIYLSIASGDRERPLIINYPFPRSGNPGVLNRAYMVIDQFSGTPLDLDDSNRFEDLSAGTSCAGGPSDTPEGRGKDGWFINLNASSTTDPNANVGEQAVTSSTIFAGLVFFSTNRPVPTPPGACANNLGEARGYALNLLNASGAADTLNICGGLRSGIFKGGGLPPSPVTGTVPVGPGGQPVTVMIGGVQRGGGVSAPIGAQRVTPTITQRRSRVYWYTDGDK
jgi:type IV pilus assembly protein PilY1